MVTGEQRAIAAIALRSVAAQAQLLAVAIERNILWPGDLRDGVAKIHQDLTKVPKE